MVFLCTLVYFTNKTITKSKYNSMMIEGIVIEGKVLFDYHLKGCY